MVLITILAQDMIDLKAELKSSREEVSTLTKLNDNLERSLIIRCVRMRKGGGRGGGTRR